MFDDLSNLEGKDSLICKRYIIRFFKKCIYLKYSVMNDIENLYFVHRPRKTF